jgi:hypothetical protein
LIVHQRSSKIYIIYNSFNLMIFDGLSNDNEIWMTINLQVEKNIFIIFFIFLFFLKIHCQSCQNNPLSTYPFSKYNAFKIYICSLGASITKLRRISLKFNIFWILGTWSWGGTTRDLFILKSSNSDSFAICTVRCICCNSVSELLGWLIKMHEYVMVLLGPFS